MRVSNTATPFDVQRADTAEMPFNIISKANGVTVARVCLLGDAEFIKRACNAHDGLVAALILAQHRMTELRPQYTGLQGMSMDRDLRTVQDALTLHGGPQVELVKLLVDALKEIVKNDPNRQSSAGIIARDALAAVGAA
jgi:hypothetical protein